MIALKRHYTSILLLLLLLAAFSLRVYGINWDDGHMFHPDERHILMVTQRLALPDPLTLSAIADAKSPMNPASFAYGSLSFYLLAIMTQLFVKLSPVLQPFVGHPILPDFDNMRIIGRAISAAFDTGTVFLTYLIGKRLYHEKIGLLAAAFVTFSVIDIQLSHFYASDTLLTFFILLSVLTASNLVKRVGPKNCAIAGAAIGLALATKVSAAPILIVLAAAHGLRLFVDSNHENAPQRFTFRRPTMRELGDTVLYLEISLATAIIVFVAIQPYFILDFNTFMRNVLEQNDMVRGIADLPYTRQYINTPPYLYHLQNLITWGLGIPLGILSVCGLAYILLRNCLRPRGQDIFLLSWVLVYLLITGSFHTKFMRYLLPMVPFICIFGAVLLISLLERVKQSSLVIGFMLTHVHQKNPADSAYSPIGSTFPATDAGHVRPASERPSFVQQLRHIKTYGLAVSKLGTSTVTVVTAVIVAITVFYAIAYMSVYSMPHTAVEASKWIYQNVPAGSSIAIEHWEEGMPVPLIDDGRPLSADGQRYHTNVLELYEPDGPVKQNHIVDRLLSSDYIIFFSNRLYGTIPRLPERYPLTTKYYQLLFGEQLGFKLEAAFTSYPSLLSVTLQDDTFSAPGLPTPDLLRRFQPSRFTINLGKADESFTVYDHPKVLIFKKTEPLSPEVLRSQLGNPAQTAQKTGLMMDQQRFGQMTAWGTFKQLFNSANLENNIPIVVWIILIEILGLAAAPLAFRALSNLPDKGYGVAKTLGVLLLGWLTWMIASIGWLPNARATVALMLLLEILIGAGIFWLQRRSIERFVRTKYRLVITTELVFWGAFALFLAIRMANPDLWHPYRGGEKPMDLAYLMAAIKSVQFPPYDPWFAGGYMNYYYFGQVIIATLIKLSGIVPTIAYNLAVPLLFALTAGGIFSVAYGLIGNTRDKKLNRDALYAGLSAVAFALILGNLGGAFQIIDQIGKTAANATRAALPASSTSWLDTLWLFLASARALDIPSDWYWASTRIIQGTINEFPFFTFLYADLHAHMIALPFTMLVMALAVHFVKGGNHPSATANRDSGKSLPNRASASTSSPSTWSLALAALALGALYVTNSWDFPTYVLVIGAAMLIPWYHDRPLDYRALIRPILHTLIIVCLAILFYLPFYGSFQSFYFGVEPFSDKSDFRGYLVINGLFLFVLISFLIVKSLRRYGDSATLRTISLVLGSPGRGERLVRLYKRLVKRISWTWPKRTYEIVIALVLLAALIWLKLYVVALLAVMLLVTLAVIAKRERRTEETFVLFLIIVGAALGIGVEFFAIKGDVGRMNTVFKFYLQVWMFWSIAAAFAVRWLLQQLSLPKFAIGRYLWMGIFAVLVCSAAVYPTVATRARVNDRFDTSIGSTLDGMAYMKTAVYRDQPGDMTLAHDLKAIRWIQENVIGSPVILEGQTPFYRWGSRVSIYTGLPTVLGWDWHQKQQRWGYQWMVDKRATDISIMYTSTSREQTLALLREYDVSYIYVGDLERLYYPGPILAKFDAMVGTDLEMVYDDAGVRIYKVKG